MKRMLILTLVVGCSASDDSIDDSIDETDASPVETTVCSMTVAIPETTDNGLAFEMTAQCLGEGDVWIRTLIEFEDDATVGFENASTSERRLTPPTDVIFRNTVTCLPGTSFRASYTITLAEDRDEVLAQADSAQLTCAE